MTFEDLERFLDRRVYFELLPPGGEPLSGEGKIVALDRDRLTIETESGPDTKSPGGRRVESALADVVSIQPA